MNPILIHEQQIEVGSRLCSADEARTYALSILLAVDAISAQRRLQTGCLPLQNNQKTTHVNMRERSVIGLLSDNGWQPLMAVGDGRPSAEMTHYAEQLARDAKQNVLLQNESILTTETLFPRRRP